MALTTKFRIQMLCGGGLHGTVEYWLDTIYYGVTLDRAWHWLKNCGWGVYQGWVPESTFKLGDQTFMTKGHWASFCGELRLRLKGRCWIEDPTCPATRVAGAYMSVDVPAILKTEQDERIRQIQERSRPRRRRRA